MKDLYKILGVAENADEATIKKAYRKLAKEFHPDVTGGDKKKTERFKEINEAYAVLGDKEKRAEYDRLKHAPVRPDGMPEGFDPEAFARTFGGGGGRRGGAASPFGGLRGRHRRHLRQPVWRAARRRARGSADPVAGARRVRAAAPTSSALDVTFAEAALGTRRTVQTGPGATVEVSVPAGVETGGRLRVPGQGAPAPGQERDARATLYLEIEVRPTAPAPQRRRHRAGRAGHRQRGGAGRQGRGADRRGTGHGHRPTGDLERRAPAPARARHQEARRHARRSVLPRRDRDAQDQAGRRRDAQAVRGDRPGARDHAAVRTLLEFDSDLPFSAYLLSASYDDQGVGGQQRMTT